MDNTLDIKYFENAIDSLVNTFGIAEPVDAKHLVKLIKNKKYEECLREIVKQYSLPISFKIKIVPRGYKKSHNYFKTSGLAKTDESGKGKESITAQVSIPPNLPIFGDPKLKGFKVDIVIGEECSDHPEAFIFIVAHEVSHLLLETLRHPEKHNEIYADLVPLTLGFAEIASLGRTVRKVDYNQDNTTTTTTTTYGYMTNYQFEYALEKVNELLNNYRLEVKSINQKMDKIAQRAKKLERLIETVKGLLKDIDNNWKKNINTKDAQLLVKIHDVGYLDAYSKALSASQSIVDRHKSSFASVTHYTKKYIDQLNKFDEGATLLFTKIEKTTIRAQRDVEVLKRNFNLTYRLRSTLRLGRRDD
jgi:prefoldin subunit 5